MSSQTILSDSVTADIEYILRECGIHGASVSALSFMSDSKTKASKTNHEVRTIVASEGGGPSSYRSSPRGDRIYLVASITKILVVVAVFIAVKVKAKEALKGSPYFRFKDAFGIPLAWMFNKYSKDAIKYSECDMKNIPGNPKIDEFFNHFKGLPSGNDHILGPDATSLFTLKDLLNDLDYLTERGLEYDNPNKHWSEYSNVNFCCIALAVEVLWDGDFADFMHQTLFKPLGMNSTSIGCPSNDETANIRWIVDSNGTRHETWTPLYQASGAEAAALGAYSTVNDLNTFYNLILGSFYNQSIMPGVHDETIADLFRNETRIGQGDIVFKALGLRTKLNSAALGALSMNRAQFPNETFSKYPVVLGSLGDQNVDYMAGSAVGCACSTALVWNHGGENFVVVVLTDTSGPVDAADHILRLILRQIVRLQNPTKYADIERKLENVRLMVKQAKDRTIAEWKRIEEEDEGLRRDAPNVQWDIQGTFEGVGFQQRIMIAKDDNQRTHVTVGGPSISPVSMPFELIWLDQSSFKICVPPHRSVDRLGNGDWSKLKFKVFVENNVVTKLTRTNNRRDNHYTRPTRSLQ